MFILSFRNLLCEYVCVGNRGYWVYVKYPRVTFQSYHSMTRKHDTRYAVTFPETLKRFSC